TCGIMSHDYTMRARFNHDPLVTTKTLYWSPPSTRREQSALVSDEMPYFLPVDKYFAELPVYPCFTSPSITEDPFLIPPLIRLNRRFGVENLELYCLGSLFEAKSIKKIAILLYITNHVYWGSRDQYRMYADHAATQTAKFVEKSASWLAGN
ncbi:MAG: hypothetical protein OXC40_02400, partial [Proteobacteria bacterium]|nr:hypothetical protein [Pseudomonadota bacterium]